MSESADYGKPIIEKIAGEDITFPRLLMGEYSALEDRVRKNAQAALRKRLDECGMVGKERFNELAKYDVEDVSQNAVEAYLGTSDGAKRALTMSLALDGKTAEKAEAIVRRLDILNASNLALALVGFYRRIDFNEEAKKVTTQFPLSNGGDEKGKNPEIAS